MIRERPDGSRYTNSSDLGLTFDHQNGNQTIGLRFQQIPLALGTQVQRAYIQFATDKAMEASTHLVIRTSTEIDAAPFTSVDYDLSQRNLSDL